MTTPEEAREIAEILHGIGRDESAEIMRDLANQVEALQADAERYRFAIQHPDFGVCKWGRVRSYDGVLEDGWEIIDGYELDAAIDAARSEK